VQEALQDLYKRQPYLPQPSGGSAFQNRLGGAGGGAGAAGTSSPNPQYLPTSSPNAGLAGGAGVASSITGSSVTRAGGGGSAGIYVDPANFPNPGVSRPGAAGAGGAGGGGPSAVYEGGLGTAGTANTGGGGGGGSTIPGSASGYGTGGAGGSGVVIIKEPAVVGSASGVWNMDAVYEYVTEGKWTNA